ncbi:MAG: peptidoglycan DD-metalloendopeptidase family protein, partial [Chitinophagaceae bacterium]
EKQQKEKERIVSKLKSRQNELSAQLTNKRKQDAKLRNMVTAMIKREIEKAREEARAKALAETKTREAANRKNIDNSNTGTVSTPVRKSAPKEVKKGESILVTSDADRVLDASFERNRGSLPWPADGFILIPNGAYKIPGTNISGNNPGVTLGTQVGASVKAIFDGEVTLVSYMDDKQVVFIKHGKYFSVYSNLSSANVQRGQMVKTGQLIGKAAPNDDGQGQVDLILMKESNNVNPEAWLRRK